MLKNVSKTIAMLWVMAGSATSVSAQENQDNYRHVFMIGGGLEVCSSFNSDRCDDVDWIDSEQMRTDRYLNLSEKFRIEATSDRVWTAFREETRKKVADALQLIHERVNEDIMSERVFEREFTRRATLQTYNKLSDAEYAKIIDLLEVPMSSDFPEVVNVEESLNAESASLLRRLADFAQQTTTNDEQPLVYFSTAGHRDPYQAIDYYQSLFEQLGANAKWLPLDAAVVAARNEGRCEELHQVQEEVLGAYDRQRVYVDDYRQQQAFCQSQDAEYEMLQEANAVFFAGDSAHLIRESLVKQDNSPSDLLRMMVARVQQKKLVVGGNNGGAAVLTAKPMVSNGSTASAIKDGGAASNPATHGCDLDNTCPPNTGPDSLTYHPFGGISLFHFASVDTEFSEQGRQGRLIRLAAESSTALSLGIDENTAMLVNLEKGDFDIIGERGVFFVEHAQGSDNAVASTFHYLISGATGMINPQGLQTAEFADGSNIVQEDPTTNFLTDRGLIDSMRVLCGDREQITLINKEYRLLAQAGKSSRTATAGGECQIINGKIGIAYQPQEEL